MTVRTLASLLVTVLALPLAMAAQQTPATQANNPGPLAKADQMFLKAIIQEDISEISLADMVLQKTSNAQVKDYAQTKILAADPQMRDRAASIARDHGMQPPSQPNARQKQMHDKLSQKSAQLFDDAYMNYEASQQHGDDQLVQAEIKSTSNPKLKSYATEEQKPVHGAATSAKNISREISSRMTHYKQSAQE
jgi:putative membrane protein